MGSGVASRKWELLKDAQRTNQMKAKMRTIMQAVPDILKWASTPVLLVASLFSVYATEYAPVVDLIVCLAAASWFGERFSSRKTSGLPHW